MKKLLILAILLFMVVGASAWNNWFHGYGEADEVGTYYVGGIGGITVPQFSDAMTVRIRIPTSPVLWWRDTTTVVLETRFSPASYSILDFLGVRSESWAILDTLINHAVDTTTGSFIFPADSIETGGYTLGDKVRLRIVISDSANTDNPDTTWAIADTVLSWNAHIGFF